MWKIKAASQNFSQGKQVYHSSSAKIKYSKNQELFCLENHERISILLNWSNLRTKRTLIWTLIHIAAPVIMINLKSGLTLLESPTGTWYLQMLHVLSQFMLFRESLAQEKTQHEGWMAFHPLPSSWFSYGSSEGIKKYLQNNSNPDTFFYRIKKKNSKHETKKPHHYKKIYSCFLLLWTENNKVLESTLCWLENIERIENTFVIK